MKRMIYPGKGVRVLAVAGRRGFTLLELMIVITIIVVLIGILVPTLGRVKAKARETQTRAMLGNLQSDIEMYYTVFHGYPGPIPAQSASGPSTTAGAANKVSGAQNLLMGLSYAVFPPAPFGTPIPVNPLPPGNATQWRVGLTATGPVNWAVIRPDGNGEQLSPFFSPGPSQVSQNFTGGAFYAGVNVITSGGAPAMNTFNNFNNFPVIVDSYPDSMPILYYRRTPGVDVNSANAALLASPDPSTPAPYYSRENFEYTQVVINCPNSATNDQRSGVLGPAEITELVRSDSGANATARGSYLLVAAGSDRVYGKNTDSTGKVTKDDLTLIGGH